MQIAFFILQAGGLPVAGANQLFSVAFAQHHRRFDFDIGKTVAVAPKSAREFFDNHRHRHEWCAIQLMIDQTRQLLYRKNTILFHFRLSK